MCLRKIYEVPCIDEKQMFHVNVKNSRTLFALVSLASFPGVVTHIVYWLETLQRWMLQ